MKINKLWIFREYFFIFLQHWLSRHSNDFIVIKSLLFEISGELLRTLSDFLSNMKRRVVLNGQNSSWTNVNSGVPQVSILCPLLFLNYVNDLTDNLTFNAKLFADDTSLFLVVHNVNTAKELNDDLKKVNDWDFQRKMSFNPDLTKQA